MIKVRFRFENGHFEIMEFASMNDARRFANTSPDKIVEILRLGETSSN